jgi:hypothetical protein
VHTANMASGPDPVADDRPSSLAWQPVDSLEVTQIVLAILEARKTMPWATAATVTRERHGDAVRVCVTMLKDSPPADYGEEHGDTKGHAGTRGTSEVIAAFEVHRLGDDLARAFGDSDVITLK